ncbi:hypothetical protein Tco_0315920 [Tanacetum coccineum]
MPPSSSSPPRRHHPSHHRHHGCTTAGAFSRGSSQWGVCLCGLNPTRGCVGFILSTMGAFGFMFTRKGCVGLVITTSRVRWDGWQPPEKGVLFVVVPGSAAGVFVLQQLGCVGLVITPKGCSFRWSATNKGRLAVGQPWWWHHEGAGSRTASVRACLVYCNAPRVCGL